MNAQAPAGWYPQPDGTQRYWDGTQWTEHIAPGTGTVTPVASSEGVSSEPVAAQNVVSPQSEAAPPVSTAVPVAVPAALAGERPWWKKKRFIIPGAALLFVIVVSAIASGGDADPATSPTADLVTSETPSPKPTEAPSATPSPTPTAMADIEVPDLVGLTVEDALGRLEDLGLTGSPNTETPKAEVTGSSPESGELVFAGSTVILEAKEPPLDTSEFKSLSNRNFARLVKSPDDYIGEQYVLYALVTQFDAATGTCQFRGDASNKQQSDWYDYDENIFFTAGDGYSDCALLDDVLQDDHVKLYVTSLGSFSYDTQIGGSTTVPLFEVEKVKQLKPVD